MKCISFSYKVLLGFFSGTKLLDGYGKTECIKQIYWIVLCGIGIIGC